MWFVFLENINIVIVIRSADFTPQALSDFDLGKFMWIDSIQVD